MSGYDVAPDPHEDVEIYTLVVDAAGEVVADCGIVGRDDDDNEAMAQRIAGLLNLERVDDE